MTTIVGNLWPLHRNNTNSIMADHENKREYYEERSLHNVQSQLKWAQIGSGGNDDIYINSQL